MFFESCDGNSYAVDAATGKLKWKFKTGGERRFTAAHLHGTQPVGESMPDPFDFYLSSAVVSNGTVYFGSGDGNVYALDAAPGQLKWKFPTGDRIISSPVWQERVLYFGGEDGNIYAVDAETGRQIWKCSTHGPVLSSGEVAVPHATGSVTSGNPTRAVARAPGRLGLF